MERNPLQTVATINVTKLNHMDGIAKMCKIEMVFNADFFFISEFLSCTLSTLLLSFSVKMTYINYSMSYYLFTVSYTFFYNYIYTAYTYNFSKKRVVLDKIY